MRFLTLGEVLALHRRILAESGGRAGVRDIGAIASAVVQPKVSVGGQDAFSIDGMNFGVFQIAESLTKPIIVKKNEGKDQQITNGGIFYRYAGRTQTIQYAELQAIIERRVEQNNRQWSDLMAKIGRAGPQNAAILDTERALIEKNDAKVLVLD